VSNCHFDFYYCPECLFMMESGMCMKLEKLNVTCECVYESVGCGMSEVGERRVRECVERGQLPDSCKLMF